MTDEHVQQLRDRFPFYTRRRDNGCDVPVSFGVNDGWFEILWKLSEKIETILKTEGEGVETTKRTKQAKVNPFDEFYIAQIKEKFGTLRFYANDGTRSEAISAAITEAERASACTCETCGQPGVLRDGGWMVVACDEHSGGQSPVEEDDDAVDGL